MTDEGGSGRADATGARCRMDIDTDGGHGWRMIAQNGRVVAVSALSHGGHGECRAAFEELCAGQHGLTGGVQHTPGGNGWMWLLGDPDGRATAVSARAYERHSTCRAAYERFRALLTEMGGVTGSCL
ncbi:hypothetical protein ABZ622_00645 [Streptomyces sp. NPDC007164]|uniref:hypothetical protein n=1 Tax=Streptomyces sp. NPDC007164 TaxID=3156918 RepID=UPI0033E9774B